MELPQLFVVTGVMAAGKSTVAEALAERFPRSAHVRGDWFRRSVVRGYAPMSPEPSPEATADLRLRYQLAAQAADTYAAAGFFTVVQDVIIGEELGHFLDRLRTRPVGVVVLAPTPDVVAQREATRAKKGYADFTPGGLDAALRADTPQIGLWLDTSALTVDETVDTILRDAAKTLVR